MKGLKADYNEAKGNDPDLMGGPKGALGQETFASHAEVTEAMKDPRYEKDPAYRKMIYHKLNNSDLMSSGEF